MSKDEYVEEANEIVGTWDLQGVLNFRPMSQRTFRNKKFKERDTTLIIGIALAPASCTDKDGVAFTCEAGDAVGVFYKAGMRALLNMGECRVKIKRDPELDKDVGKGKDMHGFRVKRHSEDTPKPLNVAYDYRDAKQTAALPAGAATAADKEYESDDIPF